eukprot:scaffold568_cov233-Pinguiococcus_pyrenoidosus.AAC.3
MAAFAKAIRIFDRRLSSARDRGDPRCRRRASPMLLATLSDSRQSAASAASCPAVRPGGPTAVATQPGDVSTECREVRADEDSSTRANQLLEHAIVVRPDIDPRVGQQVLQEGNLSVMVPHDGVEERPISLVSGDVGSGTLLGDVLGVCDDLFRRNQDGRILQISASDVVADIVLAVGSLPKLALQSRGYREDLLLVVQMPSHEALDAAIHARVLEAQERVEVGEHPLLLFRVGREVHVFHVRVQIADQLPLRRREELRPLRDSGRFVSEP